MPYRVLTVVGVLLLGACQASPSQPEVLDSAVTSIDVPTTTPSSSEPVDGPLPEVRNLAFGYWEAFNAYDTEQVLSYLQTDYREERERRDSAETEIIRLRGIAFRMMKIAGRNRRGGIR